MSRVQVSFIEYFRVLSFPFLDTQFLHSLFLSSLPYSSSFPLFFVLSLFVPLSHSCAVLILILWPCIPSLLTFSPSSSPCSSHLLSSQHPRRLIKALNSSFLLHPFFPFTFLFIFPSSFLVLTILSLIHSCLVSFSISFLSLSLFRSYTVIRRELFLFLHLIKI